MTLKRSIRLAISLGFFAGARTWQFLYVLAGKKLRGQAVVFYYHHIESKDRERFARQMDHLLRWAQPIAADHTTPLQPGVCYAAITFDDGFPCVLENAVPVLQERGIPATMFVIAGLLGQLPQNDPIENCLTRSQLRQMAASITVGSHSMSHQRMTELSLQDARAELVQSREHLREITGCAPTLFAFPFGSYNETLVQLCRETGYERTFIVEENLAFRDPRVFVTGRVNGEGDDSLLEFHLKLMGAYRWIPWVGHLRRTVWPRATRGGKVTF